jgi:hypothetical protein
LKIDTVPAPDRGACSHPRRIGYFLGSGVGVGGGVRGGRGCVVGGDRDDGIRPASRPFASGSDPV